MVAGSTLLSESVPVELRAAAQGLSDLLMGLAGALAGAVSGVIVEGWGYPTLTLLAAIATAPLAANRGDHPQPGGDRDRDQEQVYWTCTRGNQSQHRRIGSSYQHGGNRDTS
jgi:MFS family permease